MDAAAERNVERISEASRHIPRSIKAKPPEIAWRKVAGIGNLRYDCPIVDDSLIWELVVRDLPPLKAAVEQMLGGVDASKSGK